MAKPDPWRTDPAAYPFTEAMATRYQDLDTHEHVNNVAMAALFENGRVRFNRRLITHKRDDQRWLIASLTIEYLDEAYFPADIDIACGVGPIGNRSWTIQSAAFQEGRCIATCDAVIVVSGPERARAIDPAFRAALEGWRVRGSA